MKSWYAFIDGNPLIPENYYLVTEKPAFRVGKKICAIYAKNNGIYPEPFSKKLKTHIANALVTGLSQPLDSDHVVLLKH